MGKKSKLCKLVKKDLLDEDVKAYIKLVDDAKYLCVKCGRVANNEDLLCKAKKLSKK